MVDLLSEDPREQTGPLVRPYIAANGQRGVEADRRWSEEPDGRAGGAPVAGPGGGDLLADESGDLLADESGDVLANDWDRGNAPDNNDHGGPAGAAELGHEGRADEYAEYDDRLQYDDRSQYDDRPEYDEYHDGSGYGGRAGRAAYAESEYDGSREGDGSDAWRGVTTESDTDPKGFLGAGGRSQPDPEDDEEEGGRRGGVLLRIGGAALAVVAAIWVLIAWVGGSSESDCPGGKGCTAKPAASPAASVATDEEPDDDSVPPESVEPTDMVSPVPSSSVPVATPRATYNRTVVTPTARSTSDTPVSRPGTAERPRPSSTMVRVNPSTGAVVPNEQTAQPSSEPEVSTEPSPEPEPEPVEQERPRGLLDWLFRW